jgi:hypothetical protein
MDQDKTVNRILRDLGQFGLVVKDVTGEPKTGEYRIFLNALWVAAWEEGIHSVKQYNNRQRAVEQLDMNSKKLNEFISIAEAVKKTGEGKNVIGRSIKFNSLTQKKHIWRYKKEEHPNKLNAPQP